MRQVQSFRLSLRELIPSVVTLRRNEGRLRSSVNLRRISRLQCHHDDTSLKLYHRLQERLFTECSRPSIPSIIFPSEIGDEVLRR